MDRLSLAAPRPRLVSCPSTLRLAGLLFGLLASSPTAFCQNGPFAPDAAFVGTVAGTGEAAFSGDGGPASRAEVASPESIAVDLAGNVYFPDSLNDRVRRIAPDGTITTVAGDGIDGFGGDGGPAVAAHLSQPEGVATDRAGNLFIADYRNHRVRRVAPDGTISTVAGGGEGPGADGGPAVGASLRGILSVAVDARGVLYIADAEDHRVRTVTPDGRIGTAAGTGVEGFFGDGLPAIQASLDRPTGIAVDRNGNLFIADSWNLRIRKVDATGIITTVAGSGDPTAFAGGFAGDDGPADAAALSTPTDIAVDAAGELFIADTFNNRIRRVAPDGTIATVVGNGIEGAPDVERSAASDTPLAGPNGVAIDATGSLWIADSENQRIRTVYGVAEPGLVAGRPFAASVSGDVNGDGKVNVLDAILVLQYAVRLIDLDAGQRAAADVIRDGRIDVRDAVGILHIAVGLSP